MHKSTYFVAALAITSIGAVNVVRSGPDSIFQPHLLFRIGAFSLAAVGFLNLLVAFVVSFYIFAKGQINRGC